jgi:DNA-binding SARP family transcriptional activator/Tfp pilus assembly protein PilF
MSKNLRFHLFGPFEVFRNGQFLRSQDWHSQQTRTICKILLANRGQVVTSDQIIDLLWPEDSLDASRKRLHVRISQLRKALGSGKSIVKTVDGGYVFYDDNSFWLDVSEFQYAMTDGERFQKAGQLSEAICSFEIARNLYRGDLFAEDLYADWAYTEREFFGECFIHLLIELSECYAREGRYRLAIARGQEALARDPFRETLYVRLMLIYYYAGERSQSLRTFQQCCDMLSDQLGVDPLPSTQKLAEQIQAGILWANTEAPRYPPPSYEGLLFQVPHALSETPLVGREREYSWLVEHWKSAETQVILIDGIAGTGKTRLVNAFAEYISSKGATVLRARITPGEDSPLAPLITALKPVLDRKKLTKLSPPSLSALCTLFPELCDFFGDLPKLSELPPSGARERLFDAVSVLVSACAPQNSLLLVDDAHHMGSALCEVLARLVGSIKLLLTYRSDDVSLTHPIRRIFQTSHYKPKLATRQLENLSNTDVNNLIEQLAHNSLGEIGTEISQKTGGNPLYVVTLLQYMFDEGQLYVDSDGCWGVTHCELPSLPPTILETIESRLQRLNRFQRRVFDLAVVIGSDFDFELIQEASQQSEEQVLIILDELMDAMLIHEPRKFGRDEFAVVHDQYVEVGYANLPKVRKKRYHLQVAEAIEKVYASVLSDYIPALADHFHKAEVDDRALHYASLAGEQAAGQFANATALRYLSRALALTPDQDYTQRCHLLFIQEKVYDLIGDRQAQKANLDQLASIAKHLRPHQRAEIHLRQGAYAWILGDDGAALTQLEESISLAKSSQAKDIEARGYLQRGRAVLDQELARQDLEYARRLSQIERLRALEGDIVRCLGNACFWQNSYEESQTYFEEALAIHRETGDLRGELSAHNNIGHLRQNIGDFNVAVKHYEQGLKICQRIGDRLAEGVLLSNLGGVLADLGTYDQAEIRLKQAVNIRDAVNNQEGVGSLLPVLGDILRRRGKYKLAAKKLERALKINTGIPHPAQICLSLDGLSQLYRALGDYVSALDHYERALDVFDDQHAPNRVRALANGCLLYHLMDDNLKALDVGEKALKTSMNFPQIRATALTNLGSVLTVLQEFPKAEDQYQQALALRYELRQPHLVVEPLAGLARSAFLQGDLSRALAYVEQILDGTKDKTIEGPDRPFQIYFICYQVLNECQDVRARKILYTAHRMLKKRAGAIDDERLRQSYLYHVKVNQEILHRCN